MKKRARIEDDRFVDTFLRNTAIDCALAKKQKIAGVCMNFPGVDEHVQFSLYNVDEFPLLVPVQGHEIKRTVFVNIAVLKWKIHTVAQIVKVKSFDTHKWPLF